MNKEVRWLVGSLGRPFRNTSSRKRSLAVEPRGARTDHTQAGRQAGKKAERQAEKE